MLFLTDERPELKPEVDPKFGEGLFDMIRFLVASSLLSIMLAKQERFLSTVTFFGV